MIVTSEEPTRVHECRTDRNAFIWYYPDNGGRCQKTISQNDVADKWTETMVVGNGTMQDADVSKIGGVQ